MTIHPVLPPAFLGVVVVVLVGSQAIALRRWYSSSRNPTVLWRWAGVTSAAVLLLVAAARPVITDDEDALTRSAGDSEPNVFLVVDRSPDMAVRDLDDRTRMDVARDDILALIDRYPRARFAVISFASAPTLDWPLSADAWSLRPVIDTAKPYAYDAGAVTMANAGAANTMLRYQLISAAAQFPRAQNLVFYLGAGAGESRLPPTEFNPPAETIDGGAALGYGTAGGGPIPGTDFGRSPVDESALERIAAQLNVPYVARSNSAPLADVLPADRAAPDQATVLATAGGHTEIYWLPALVAAVLILIELYLVLRTFRRSALTGVSVEP